MCSEVLGDGWSHGATHRAVRAMPPRTGRAVRFAWRLLLATTTTACGARTDLGQTDAARADAGHADAALGDDGGRDAAVARDSGQDAGRDAGDVDAGEIDAGDIAIYGAPPMEAPSLPDDLLPPPTPARPRRRRRTNR